VFCTIPLLSFSVRGVRVLFEMMISFIGFPIYVLLIFAGNAGSGLELILNTLLMASGVGLATVLICHFTPPENTA